MSIGSVTMSVTDPHYRPIRMDLTMRDQFQELKYYSSLGDKGPEIDRLKEMLPFMAAELGEVEETIQ